MLWTIIPEEVVFEEEGDGPELVEVKVSGITMEVEPQGFGRGRIIRIISSDPQVYLHPAFQPGQEFDLLGEPS